MLINEAAFFEQLPAFSFGLLGCPLSTASGVLAAIQARDPHHYELASGEFALTEVVAQLDDGTIIRRRRPEYYLALLFTVPDTTCTLVVSTVPDGWITLCNDIALRAGTYRYMFEWSDRNSANARNAFSYIDYSAGSPVERVVYAMKDPEWIFFQSGTPLWFEDIKFYERRLKRERINKTILEMYLMKLAINIRNAIFPTKTQMGLKFIHTW